MAGRYTHHTLNSVEPYSFFGKIPAYLILILLSIILGFTYSVRPFRLKAIPIVDLCANALGYGGIAFLVGWLTIAPIGSEAVWRSLPYLFSVAAAFVNTTLPDIKGDSLGNDRTTGVWLGKKQACRLSLALLIAAIAAAAFFRDWIAGAAGIVCLPIFIYMNFRLKQNVIIWGTRIGILVLSLCAGGAISAVPTLVWDSAIRYALVLYNPFRNPLSLKKMKTLFAYLELTRPLNGVIAFISAWLGGMFASQGRVENIVDIRLLLVSISALALLSAGNAINDYCDYNIDRINRPKRPLPSGRIRRRDALIFAIVLVAIGIYLGALINRNATGIAILVGVALVSYAFWLKRTPFVGNLVVSGLTV